MRPLLAAAALIALLAGCDASTPQPAAQQPPAEIGLRPSDVRPPVATCQGTGAVDAYIKALRQRDPSSAAQVEASWSQARSHDANAGWAGFVSDDSAACLAGLLPDRAHSAFSIVIRYPDATRAIGGWQRGILDLPTPSTDQLTPGLAQGLATGLTVNSWSYQRTAQGRPSYLAFWQNGSFDVLLATSGLSPEESQSAATSINGRVR